jgi:hypothetical protein
MSKFVNAFDPTNRHQARFELGDCSLISGKNMMVKGSTAKNGRICKKNLPIFYMGQRK